jgi:uncharacterized protein (DUF697 family)
MAEFTDAMDDDAESVIRWGAARGGAVVIVPLLGSASLLANQVYMIVRLGGVYGVALSTSAAAGFLGGLAGSIAAATAATLVPLPFVQVPIAVATTYAVGKVAQQWIKDGMPTDPTAYRETFARVYKSAKDRARELKNDPRGDQPLGDEKRKF